jgi:ribonuclease-3
MSTAMMDFLAIEESLGIKFKDKALLQRALTHRSYLNEHPDYLLEDNERLEFLGDAILDFVTGEYLYHHFPEMREGQLTSLRAALVRTETLAQFAKRLSLGDHLLLGTGEAESGGRQRIAVLGDSFEALIGALYLDQGLISVQNFVHGIIGPEVNRILAEAGDKDAKSLLQELSQGYWQITPTYRTVSEDGPDHAKVFTVEALIGGKPYGRGIGPSKQSAAQVAAREALERLSREIGQNGSAVADSYPSEA